MNQAAHSWCTEVIGYRFTPMLQTGGACARISLEFAAVASTAAKLTSIQFPGSQHLRHFLTSHMTVATAEVACTPASTAATVDADSKPAGPPYTDPKALDAHIQRAWEHFRRIGSPQLHVAPMVDQVLFTCSSSSSCNHQYVCGGVHGRKTQQRRLKP